MVNILNCKDGYHTQENSKLFVSEAVSNAEALWVWEQIHFFLFDSTVLREERFQEHKVSFTKWGWIYPMRGHDAVNVVEVQAYPIF
jgi:hypothetical protein